MDDFRTGQSLTRLADDLAAGRQTASALVEASLQRIDAVSGQGGVVFLKVHHDEARLRAAQIDALRSMGAPVPAFAGIPIAVKDNFDEQGHVTTAGSIVLKDAPAARRDAIAIARLRTAGFIAIGRTNMTEFAFSGLGLNPHYGTPLSPYGRGEGRIAGGSSSGTAAAIASGMAAAGVGTDTGGSCRIPAAFCGLVGFRPTQARVPLGGVMPLSQTLDAVGPLGHTVSCCAVLDSIMSGGVYRPESHISIEGLRLAIPQTLVFDDVQSAVLDQFYHAVATLERAGAFIRKVQAASLGRIAGINAKGGFAAAESWAMLRQRLDTNSADFDPRVSSRVARGQEQSAADYLDLQDARQRLIADFSAETAGFDAVIFPTTPMVAPQLSELSDDADYARVNLLALRNPATANMLDRPAISLPLCSEDALPTGFMMMGLHGQDRTLLAHAQAAEHALRP